MAIAHVGKGMMASGAQGLSACLGPKQKFCQVYLYHILRGMTPSIFMGQIFENMADHLRSRFISFGCTNLWEIPLKITTQTPRY